MPNFIHSLFAESIARGTKSSALQTLLVAMGMLIIGLPLTIYVGAPSWLLICLFSALGIVLLTFIVAYIYFLKTNPDALRSESFTLKKMAMELGLVGDNITGLKDASTLEHTKDEPKALTSGEDIKP